MIATPDKYPTSLVLSDMAPLDTCYVRRQVLRSSSKEAVAAIDFSRAVSAVFLRRSPMLDESSWRTLLELMSNALNTMTIDHYNRLERHLGDDGYLLRPIEQEKQWPAPAIYQVIFIDGEWVTWTGTNTFMSLRTGEVIAELPSPGLEQVAYNLTELTRREYVRCLAVMDSEG